MRYLMILLLVLSMFSFACYEDEQDSKSVYTYRVEGGSGNPVDITYTCDMGEFTVNHVNLPWSIVFESEQDPFYYKVYVLDPLNPKLSTVALCENEIIGYSYGNGKDGVFPLSGYHSPSDKTPKVTINIQPQTE